MKNLSKFKRCIVLLAFMLPIAWCGATIIHSADGYSAIQIEERTVQSIGDVTMELDKDSGPMVFSYPPVETPDSFQFYINQTGDYIITFTLSNGDEYYGEFTVTD